MTEQECTKKPRKRCAFVRNNCPCPDDEVNFIKSIMPYILPLPDILKMQVRIGFSEVLCQIFDENDKETKYDERRLHLMSVKNALSFDEAFFWGIIPLIKLLKPEKRLSVRLQLLNSLKKVLNANGDVGLNNTIEDKQSSASEDESDSYCYKKNAKSKQSQQFARRASKITEARDSIDLARGSLSMTTSHKSTGGESTTDE